MKKFKGISLRLRLTLLTAAVMVLVAIALTVGSINRAGAYFVPDNYVVQLKEPIAQVNIDNTTDDNPSTVQASANITVKSSDTSVSAAKTEGNNYMTVPMEKISLYDVTAEQSDQMASSATFKKTEVVPAEAYQLETMTLTVAAKRKFAFSSTWMLFAAMLAGVILTWIMAGRALKPVKALAGAIDTIDAHNLSARIENIQTHDEIRQLADNFNHMLDKLEQAFEQQRTFSANAAHELKTPLAAIRTNLEVLALEDDPTSEEYQETLDVIGRNTDRLIDLVGNLLELNDQQNIDLHEAIDTESIVDQLLFEQAAAIEAKNLNVALENHLPKLYANRQLLASALSNLLENAVKYQHADGNILLSLYKQADAAVLSVWDDGPGITAEQLPHVFDPFYRCDPSRSSKISGSGLGLSLVRTIVERHGGQVSVRSDPESGTCFTITLPDQPC